jgi:hypothetical protein
MRQFSAASRSFAICASSSDPATMISASMPVIRPWASVALRRDSNRVSGHCCRSANRRTFDSFQVPMAPSSISAGDGPSSPPPASAGASSTTRCGPIVASAFIPLIHCTLTVLPMSVSLLDASRGGDRARPRPWRDETLARLRRGRYFAAAGNAGSLPMSRMSC